MGGDLKGGGVAQLLVCSRVAQDACEYGDLLKIKIPGLNTKNSIISEQRHVIPSED